MKRLLRLWFGLSERVDRRTYFLTGAGLMLFKYLVDATVVWSYTHRWWSPLDYVSPLWSVRTVALQGMPPAAMLGLALWTLPFLWIGVGMSMRRAVDAGRSGWLAVLFFIPYLKFVLIGALCVLPTAPAARWLERLPDPVAADRRRSALLGLGAALAVTIPTILLGVYFKRNYSFGLFLGTPFTAGWVSAQVFNTGHPRRAGETVRLALLAVLLAGLLLIAFAAEGAFCLILAFPLAALVAIPGALLGRAVALRGHETAGMAALLAPLLVLTEPKLPPPSYEVVSTVEIAAPPDQVWQRVVSFPDIPPPTEWLFRIGVAAPERARIVGTGVGATRYCDFTTGSFVEPITVWEPGRRLAFDIVRQAPPMHEWSPYRDVNPPHLDGYFRATHGEFELVPLPEGRTRLVGRTRYEVEMSPQGYWAVAAGQIVSAIHLRVLRHIQRIVETGSSAR
ncbi:MAG TPA: SRPBCC family protein [Gemmatimonadales bacterium]|nr:SRPBCC family protein [Gemmatimonadales bacterium]